MTDNLSPNELRYFASAGEESPTSERTETTPEPRHDPETREREPEHRSEVDEGQRDQQRDEKQVPHQAMHQERERRKQAERDAQELREKLARYEGMQEALKQRDQPKPNEQQIPAWEEDPKGHIEARLRQLAEQQGQLTQAEQSRIQTARQQQALSELQNWGQAQETEFAKTNADYSEAVKHLQKSRTDELRALGANDQQIQQQIAIDTMQLAQMARQQGGNFADRIYNLAKLRGYQPKQAQQQENAEAKIDRQNRGKELSSTGGSGSAPASKITAARLNEMSEREYYEFSQKNPDEFRRILSGG